MKHFLKKVWETIRDEQKLKNSSQPNKEADNAKADD